MEGKTKQNKTILSHSFWSTSLNGIVRNLGSFSAAFRYTSVFLHFYQFVLRRVNARRWKKRKQGAAASAVTWCLSLQKCRFNPLSYLENRWCFMLNIISTASLSVPLTFSTCVKPNQCLMNMLGAVCMKLVPVGAGPQVPSSLLKPCSWKRQEIFTSRIIK